MKYWRVWLCIAGCMCIGFLFYEMGVNVPKGIELERQSYQRENDLLLAGDPKSTGEGLEYCLAGPKLQLLEYQEPAQKKLRQWCSEHGIKCATITVAFAGRDARGMHLMHVIAK